MQRGGLSSRPPKEVIWGTLWRVPQRNQQGLNAAESRHKPNHIRVTPQPREAHSRFPYIEKKWKAHYQKDSLHSLKQNASIKYRIYCFQVWNIHDVFIKRIHKNHTSGGRRRRACAAKSDFCTTALLRFSWILVEYCSAFPSSDRLHPSKHNFF